MINIEFDEPNYYLIGMGRDFEKELDLLEGLLIGSLNVPVARAILHSMETILRFCELFESGTIKSFRINRKGKDYPFTKEGPADLFAEIFARIESEWGQVMETQEGWQSYLTEKNPLAKILFAQYIFTRWHAFKETHTRNG